MERALISRKTRDHIVRAGGIVLGGWCGESWDLRQGMEKLGIKTTEVLPISRGGVPREIASVEVRMQGYFETIDWRNRDDVRRIIPAFETIARIISGHHNKEAFENIVTSLAADGLRLNAAWRIVRA